MPDRTEIASRLCLIDRLIVTVIVLTYGLSLLILAWEGSARFWWVLIVPALTFVLVSLLRSLINAPRPYDLGATPLLTPSRTGRSFPSRHVASGAVIAVSLANLNPWLSVGIYGLTILLGWVRVRGGLHFPRDIMAGLLIGSACGLVSLIRIAP